MKVRERKRESRDSKREEVYLTDVKQRHHVKTYVIRSKVPARHDTCNTCYKNAQLVVSNCIKNGK